MNTFVFQPGSTWRKLGYALLSDSLGYREVLDANPFWDITKTPAPGSILYEPSTGGVGMSGLSSAPLTVGVDISSGLPSSGYYPFSSRAEYDAALSRYNQISLADVDRNNGWNANSYAVVVG